MAISDESLLVNDNSKFVTRICDECGKCDQARMGSVIKGRKRRGNNSDLCRKCSCSVKYRNTIFSLKMDKAVNWRGGNAVERGYEKVYIGNGKKKFSHVIEYENYIGRSLSDKEIIHHIDMDKRNNRLSNLYLCANRSKHKLCHSSARNCGMSLLGKEIWYNRLINRYETTPISWDLEISISLPDIPTHICKTRQLTYVRFSTGKSVHTWIMENLIGRKLYHNEEVHHIDGCGTNNNPSNLCVLSKTEHNKCHHSLELCIGDLIKREKVRFQCGVYFVEETA